MEHYVNIMLDGGFKAVFGDKQVAMDLPYDPVRARQVVTGSTSCFLCMESIC